MVLQSFGCNSPSFLPATDVEQLKKFDHGPVHGFFAAKKLSEEQTHRTAEHKDKQQVVAEHPWQALSQTALMLTNCTNLSSLLSRECQGFPLERTIQRY